MTTQPSNSPTARPPDSPTVRPSDRPTVRPSDRPTARPSDGPTGRLSPAMRLNLAQAYAANGQFRKSLTILDAMAPSKKAEVILRQAVLMAGTGRVKASRKWLAGIDPHDLSTAELRGQLAEYLMRTSQFEKALAVFDACEKMPEQSRTHYLYKALTWRCLWNLDEAAKILKEAHQNGHGAPMSRIWQARLAWLRGDNPAAIDILKTIVSADTAAPSDREICLADSGVVYRSLGRLDKALEYFEKRKTIINAGHWLCRCEHALTLCAAGRVADAVAELNSSEEIYNYYGNPCSMLRVMLISELDGSGRQSLDYKQWTDNLSQTLTPFLPYSTYMGLWAATAMARAGNFKAAKAMIAKTIKLTCSGNPCLVHDAAQNTRARQRNEVSLALARVAKAIYPNFADSAFEIQMLVSPDTLFSPRKDNPEASA